MPFWHIAAYMLILCWGPGYRGSEVIGPNTVLSAPVVFRATWLYQMTVRSPNFAPAFPTLSPRLLTY